MIRPVTYPVPSRLNKFIDRWRGTYAFPNRQKSARLVALGRSDWRCCFCGFDFLSDPNSLLFASAEHIVPRANGGGTSARNIMVSCTACNSIRGSRRANSFEELRELILRRKAVSIAELLEMIVAYRRPFPRVAELSAQEERLLAILRRVLAKRSLVTATALRAIAE